MRRTRIAYANAVYHIYNQGVNRNNIFLDQEDDAFWVNLLRATTIKYGTRIFCFVTMRNHFHCLLQTNSPNISAVMWHVGYFFALYTKDKYKRVGPLFRNRFQSQIIESPSYLRNVVRYIHNNPLQNGLAASIEEDSPEFISSYRTLCGQTTEFNWLDKAGLAELLDAPNDRLFKELLWHPIDRDAFKTMTKLENCTHRLKQV